MSEQKLEIKHFSDSKGNPGGGRISGIGLEVFFQDGPLGRSGADRRSQNGCFVEDLINSAMSRLRFYQSTKFACEFNEEAISHLQKALKALHERTKDREVRKVEGTYEL